MQADKSMQTSAATETYVDHTLQHRLTRRALLRSAAGLGAGALAAGVAGPALAGLERWNPKLRVDQFDSEVATAWFRLALQITPTTSGVSTQPAIRAFAYLGVTLYEALVPGMPGYRSLAGRLNDLQPIAGPPDHSYHWPTVANSALAASTRELFRMTTDANKAAINQLEFSLAARLTPGVPPGIAKRSAERGRQVATHIMAWASTDGGHDGHLTNFPPDYTPPVGPGLWVPTPPGFQRAYQPNWGANRPFVLTSAADYDPGPPPAFSTEPGSAFYGEAWEVYQMVNELTDEQRAMVVHWANTLGHHPSLAIQLVETLSLDLATAAEVYAKAGMAIADAGIACQYTKYLYNLIRPVSYIQQYIDAGWGNPLPIPTPPHPEYSSAHAVTSQALAQVLHDVVGDVPFTDNHTHDASGLPPRSYDSWFELAAEAGISRLFGGIHFRSAMERGFEQGTSIGMAVSAVPFHR